MNRKTMLGTLACLILFTFMITTPIAFAGDTEATGTSDGTAVVGNTAPTITNLDICISSGASSVNDTLIDSQTTYITNFTITDANTIADIKNVTWVIFEETAADWGDADNVTEHYTFKWDQDTNVFSETGPGESDDHLVTGSCSDPADNSSSTGVVQLGFKLNETAIYNSGKTWEVNVTLWDAVASDTETYLYFGVNFYSELTVTDSTHGWTSLTAGQTNQTMNNPDSDLDIVVTANANFDVQAQANHTHLIVYGDSSKNITIGHILIYENSTVALAANLTTSYADIGGLTNEAWGANQDKAMVLFISIPATQATGSYIYQLRLKIVMYT